MPPAGTKECGKARRNGLSRRALRVELAGFEPATS
jgi:hypothetical protein